MRHTGKVNKFIDLGDELLLYRKIKIILHVVQGLSFLHKHNIVHRDIKPHNILINEDYSAKLGDYGLAEYVNNCDQHFSDHRSEGTINYMAPELLLSTSQLQSLEIIANSDAACDIYSLSISIWQLVTHLKTFFNDTYSLNKICFFGIDSNDFEMLRNIQTRKSTLAELTQPENMPEPIFIMFKNIVDKGSSMYPNIRPSADDIIKELATTITTYAPSIIGTI